MSDNKILIIGCGIAGPVIAALLKRKGYHPIVYEKVRHLGDAGASLMLMPNGMKVFNLLNLTEAIYDTASPLKSYQDFTADGTFLGGSDLPSRYRSIYGQSAVGVTRTRLNLMMKDLLLNSQIELHQGIALQSLIEEPDSILATFANGHTQRASFVIGCDGIKAATRTILLNLHNSPQPPPSYTGLTQVSGFSPMPKSFTGSSMRNYYGAGAHIIAYPISPTRISWALTVAESDEQKESWGVCSPEAMHRVKNETTKRLQGFHPAVLEIVASAERIIKFGLFDRETCAADDWHSRRIVLCGDAAHPTSPHLGQGANQALEDCYHLYTAFPDLTCGGEVKGDLEAGFARYAGFRQPRTAMLVRGARAVGEKRVVTTGEADCKARDRKVEAEWRDIDGVFAKFDGLCREPFDALNTAV